MQLYGWCWGGGGLNRTFHNGAAGRSQAKVWMDMVMD